MITLDVGGNDLLAILSNPALLPQVLDQFKTNLTEILKTLRTNLPQTRIYISNLYSIPEIIGSEAAVQAFNLVVAGVANAFGIPVADVYTAFQGRSGLLLIERHGADPLQVHPTNAGYRVIEQAFKAVITP